jgi:uncharacterized alpha/beta hydrolase family protein
MPTYTFQNRDTGEEFDKFMSISARESYLKENPHLTPIIGLSNIVHERGTNLKVSDGFREVMSKIKNTYKVNKIKDY